MQTLKLKVTVRDRRIEAEWPADVSHGEVQLVIHYEVIAPESVEQARCRHLQALFADISRHSPDLSREEIDRQIAEERASLGE